MRTRSDGTVSIEFRTQVRPEQYDATPSKPYTAFLMRCLRTTCPAVILDGPPPSDVLTYVEMAAGARWSSLVLTPALFGPGDVSVSRFRTQVSARPRQRDLRGFSARAGPKSYRQSAPRLVASCSLRDGTVGRHR